MKFEGRYVWKQLGRRQDGVYYLSIFLYDTGFGPISDGQYVKFTVNGQPISIMEGNLTYDGCAPIKNDAEKGCSGRYVSCVYNYPIDTKDVRNRYGGSLVLKASSEGVMTSPCSYKRHAVYVKYELNYGNGQPTPSPTLHPTQSPTKGDTTIVNGLQFDMNKLNVWNLIQISFSVGVVLGAGAVYLCKLREKSKQAYQHPLPYAVFNLGMLGMELTSMIFLLLELFKFGYEGSGSTIIIVRFVEMLFGIIIAICVYFPPSHSFLKTFMDFSQYLDWDHMIAESKVYFIISTMTIVDLTFVVFLPWKNSRFATLSKGFPNLVLFWVVQASSLVAAVASYGVQIYFLSTTSFRLDRDLIFIVNLILLSLKLLLITVDFFYKTKVLRTAPTSLEKGGKHFENDACDVESADASNGEIVYQSNPMMENDVDKEEQESSHPLLATTLKRMQAQLSHLELEMSTMKAETENIETVVTDVGEETNLLRSQVESLEHTMYSYLPQDSTTVHTSSLIPRPQDSPKGPPEVITELEEGD